MSIGLTSSVVAGADATPDLSPDFDAFAQAGGVQNLGKDGRAGVALCGGPMIDYGPGEGAYFETQVLFISVDQSNNNNLSSRLLRVTNPAAAPIGALDASPDSTARFIGGYRCGDGLGFRIRFWDYDAAESALVAQTGPATPNTLVHSWETTVLDVEGTMAFPLLRWQGDAGLGYRFTAYQDVATTSINGGAAISTADSRYIGNGITASLGLNRQLTGRLSVVVNNRISLLLGKQTFDQPGLAYPVGPLNDSFDARYVYENQLGLSYDFPLPSSTVGYVRGGYELQYWDDFVVPIGGAADSSWTLFHGFFLSVGVRR